MNPLPAAQSPADAQHWHASRRLAGGLTLLWLLAWLAPLLFPHLFGFALFGSSFVAWMCAQGAPIVFVLLVWRYERVMARLEREREGRRAG